MYTFPFCFTVKQVFAHKLAIALFAVQCGTVFFPWERNDGNSLGGRITCRNELDHEVSAVSYTVLLCVR